MAICKQIGNAFIFLFSKKWSPLNAKQMCIQWAHAPPTLWAVIISQSRIGIWSTGSSTHALLFNEFSFHLLFRLIFQSKAQVSQIAASSSILYTTYINTQCTKIQTFTFYCSISSGIFEMLHKTQTQNVNVPDCCDTSPQSKTNK